MLSWSNISSIHSRAQSFLSVLHCMFDCTKNIMLLSPLCLMHYFSLCYAEQRIAGLSNTGYSVSLKLGALFKMKCNV